MRALVAGLGSIGMRHARNLRALGVEQLSGFDPVEERREAFRAALGGETYPDYEEALAAGVDLVIIASPNVYHLPQALSAARRGIHLFIEKPLGGDVAMALELGAIVGERGLYAHVGSNWKFHPAFRRMKALISDGEVGRVTGAQVIAGQWLPDWHPGEDFRRSYSARKDLGGGAVNDTHELDYLSWMLGPIDDIVGMTGRSGALPIETDDVAVCCLRFQNGALGSVLTDYIQRVRRRRYHISGDKGTVEWDFQTGLVQLFQPKEMRGAVFDEAVFDLNQMYVDQMARVLGDLRAGGKPETPIEHMTDIMRLQIAWQDNGRSSNASGRTPGSEGAGR